MTGSGHIWQGMLTGYKYVLKIMHFADTMLYIAKYFTIFYATSQYGKTDGVLRTSLIKRQTQKYKTNWQNKSFTVLTKQSRTVSQ